MGIFVAGRGLDQKGRIASLFGEEKVYHRDSEVYTLCDYDRYLYDATIAGKITRLDKLGLTASVELYESGFPIKASCCYHNDMYVAADDTIYKLLLDDFQPILQKIAKRSGPVHDLCVYNGRLTDAGTYGIYDTFDNREFLTRPGIVYAITPMSYRSFRECQRI
jgi:hypothetical protein